MNFVKKLMLLAAGCASTSAHAQYTDGVNKIGVIADMSSLYADLGGPGSVVAAKLAVEDFGAAAKGMKIEIISADHQNKRPEEQTVPGDRPGDFGSDRHEMQCQHDTMDLRHLERCSRHGQTGCQRWR